jgi:hypothetical protein
VGVALRGDVDHLRAVPDPADEPREATPHPVPEVEHQDGEAGRMACQALVDEASQAVEAWRPVACLDAEHSGACPAGAGEADRLAVDHPPRRRELQAEVAFLGEPSREERERQVVVDQSEAPFPDGAASPLAAEAFRRVELAGEPEVLREASAEAGHREGAVPAAFPVAEVRRPESIAEFGSDWGEPLVPQQPLPRLRPSRDPRVSHRNDYRGGH